MRGGTGEARGAPYLPDVLEPGLLAVICGHAAGERSAALGAYYAHPGNRFWPTLAATGLTPYRLAPHEFAALPRFGLGLTDVAKTQKGADSAIVPRAEDAAALVEKLARFRPRLLAFAGMKPAQRVYRFLGVKNGGWMLGLQPAHEALPETWVLASTSGLAVRFWEPRGRRSWEAFAARFKALRAATP
jgi:TDG/mug DNA glycosylase family protein